VTDFSALRDAMVDRQIAARGIADPFLLAAMRAVPREAFVADHLAGCAYDDGPLPIEAGQTISQPYIVALMIESARVAPGAHVLEIGAGSGYAAAVLGRIAARVTAIERHESLVSLARERLRRLGCANIRIEQGDGSAGWADGAPYDAILVAASGPDVPDPLRRQLAAGGSLVMPVGRPGGEQRLLRVERVGAERWREVNLGSVRFVPLIGAEGWREP
jgi:protein-L-isoaspartate(D-aspartate) O-methyltransferase